MGTIFTMYNKYSVQTLDIYRPESIWKLQYLRELYLKNPSDNFWQEKPATSNYIYDGVSREIVEIYPMNEHHKSNTRLVDHITLIGITDTCCVSLTKSQEESLIRVTS